MSNMTKAEAIEFFSELFFSEHHIPAPGFCGAHGVKEYGPGSWCVNVYGEMATWDYDALTRLVFLAHDSCIRASIQSSGPRRIKVVIFKREGRDKRMCIGHPTIETALSKWRLNHAEPIEETRNEH